MRITLRKVGLDKRAEVARVVGLPVRRGSAYSQAPTLRADPAFDFLTDDGPPLDLDDPEQRELGDYEVLEFIGRGGMGVVYRAHQRSLNRFVAIKLLAAGPWASDQFIERFTLEAQNAARLEHPNIVAIYEAGSDRELHFIAMRLIHGISLAERLERDGPLPFIEGAALAKTIADAVEYAHRMGVLHLDLKPGNILLDADGVPYVADFGMSRRLESCLPSCDTAIEGTPSYMAPEQVALGERTVSAATDIWGIGALLYEMVTGVPPFRADSVKKTIDMVRAGKLCSPRALVPTVPQELENIVQRCLARNPDDRYPNMASLSHDLEAFIEAYHAPASADPLGRLIGRFNRRSTIRSLAAFALLWSAMLLGGPTHDVYGESFPTNATAVLPFQTISSAADDLVLADGLQTQISSALGDLPELRVIASTGIARQSDEMHRTLSVGRQLKVATLVRARVGHVDGRVLVTAQLIRARDGLTLWSESFDRGPKDAMQMHAEIALGIAGALGKTVSHDDRKRLGTVQTGNVAAYNAYLRGLAFYTRGFQTSNIVASTQAFRQAVAEDPEFAQAWALRSRGEAMLSLLNQGSQQADKASALQSLQNAERLQPTAFDTLLAHAYYLYYVQGDLIGAKASFEKLLLAHRQSSELLIALARVNEHVGHVDETIRLIDEAIQLDPTNIYLYKLAMAYSFVGGDYDACHKAIDRIEEMAPSDHEAHLFRGKIYLSTGDVVHAADYFDFSKYQQGDDVDPYLAYARLARVDVQTLRWLSAQVQSARDEHNVGQEMLLMENVIEFERLNGKRSELDSAAENLTRTASAILKREPSDPDALDAVAISRAALGDLNGALRALDDELHAYTPQDDDRDAQLRILDIRTRFFARFGKDDEALDGIRQLLEGAYSGSDYGYHLDVRTVLLDPDFARFASDKRLKRILAAAPARRH